MLPYVGSHRLRIGLLDPEVDGTASVTAVRISQLATIFNSSTVKNLKSLTVHITDELSGINALEFLFSSASLVMTILLWATWPVL